MFIHDAVLESLTCGDTQIPASRLSGAIKKLKEKDRETGRTGFETQFHVCTTHGNYILALENDTAPKSVEKVIFLLANLSISQLCLPLSTQWVLSGLLVCILFSAGVVQ